MKEYINNTYKNSPQKKRRFIKDALALTVISIILRITAMGFTVYISNKIGAEGIGLFQLTFSVYYLFITFSTSGISLAVTRIVSEQLAVNNTFVARSAFRRCMMLCIILSVTGGIILFFNAQMIGVTFLKDERTIYSLKLLAFGLPFLSIGSTIRGFFLGLKKGVKAISADIVEQLIQIAVTLPLLAIMAPKGLEQACISLIIGAVISEVISCIYATIIYFTEKIEIKGKKEKRLNYTIFSIIAPSAIGYYIRSILSTTENLLVPTGLKKFGQSNSASLSQYGMIKGMVLPLIYFPSAILSAFSSLLIPEVSAMNMLKSKKRIDYIIKKSFKATLIFSFLVTGIFMSFSNEIGMAFYKSSSVSKLLFTLAPLVPLMYLDQIVDSILKGLNQQFSSMKYNTADSALRALIIFLLVPIMGLNGYIIMLYFGTIFNAYLSLNRLIVVSKVRFNIVDWVILPLIAISVSCLVTRIIFHWNLLLSILVVCVAYLFILMILGCITKRDIAWVIRIFYKK